MDSVTTTNPHNAAETVEMDVCGDWTGDQCLVYFLLATIFFLAVLVVLFFSSVAFFRYFPSLVKNTAENLGVGGRSPSSTKKHQDEAVIKMKRLPMMTVV